MRACGRFRNHIDKKGGSRRKSEVREYTAVTALGHGALFALGVGRSAVWPETRVGSVLECRRLP